MELINRGNTSILKKKPYFSSLLIEFFPVIKSSSFRKKIKGRSAAFGLKVAT